MIFTARFAAVLAAMATGLFAFAEAQTDGPAQLLSATDLQAQLGGECNDTKCTTETCNINACNNPAGCTLRTVQGVTFCAGTDPSNGEKCNDPPGNDDGYHCSQTNDQACGQELQGAPVGGSCLTTSGLVCTPQGVFCGSQRHICTQTPCGS